MKKIIILSFIFLFFAGINNNANAQKKPAQTMVNITYVWHCKPNPNAKLNITFSGYTINHGFKHELLSMKVGHNTKKIINTNNPFRFTSVNINVDVQGNHAWAHKTVTATKSNPKIGYIKTVSFKLDIYNEPQQSPK